MVRVSITVLLAGALALSACGPSRVETDPLEPTEGEEAEPAGDDEDAQRITVAVETLGNDSLDPAMEAISINQSQRMHLYDTLIGIGPDGEFAPGIAESWEMADDGLSWTFHLREGVQFHDGWGEVTAEDVAFSLERFANEEAVSGAAGQLRAAVESVEVVDSHTVTVHTNGVQVYFPLIVAPHQSDAGMVMPKRYLLEEAGEDFMAQSELLNEHPIGSGPFEFVERVRGSSILFEAVDEHWRTTPVFDFLEFVSVSEPATRMSMIRAGEVDVIAITSDETEEVENAGLSVVGIPDSLSMAIQFTGTWRPPAEGKPTADPAVRRALSLAIDRELILEELLAGRGSIPRTPYLTSAATQDIDVDDFAEWAEEVRRYNPDEARRLLAEAGYPDGFSGLTMYLIGRLDEVGEAVAAMWEQVGVQVDIETTDYAIYREHFIRADPEDDFNAGDALTNVGPTFVGVSGVLETQYAGPNLEGSAIQFLNDPELDALIVEALGERDDARRQELIKQAFDIVNDSWVVLPMFSLESLFGASPAAAADQWVVHAGWRSLGRTYETMGRES